MGNIFGILGELIPIIIGIYCITYFGGYKTPKSNDSEKIQRFNEIKDEHGKKITVLGFILVAFGVFNLVKSYIL